MFLGHFAVGFAAKSLAPGVSLGTLFFAAQFVDLLWPTLLLLGVEQVEIDPAATAVTPLRFVYYPVSHSLVAVVLWGIGLAVVYRRLRSDNRGAAVVGLAVVSHWLLDAMVHRPDLPLIPGMATRVGAGLWDSVGGTLAVELTLFTIGVAVYAVGGRTRDAVGRWGLAALVLILLAIYLGNVFGPPPPGVFAIAWVGQAQWLLIAWAFWVDRHRAWAH